MSGADDLSPAGVTARAAPYLASLEVKGDAWKRWLTRGISFALLIAVIYQINHFGFRQAIDIMPRSPLFWLAFSAYYVALPVSELIIYRRLWQVPLGAFHALLSKLVSNEVLVGYSGELFFYGWARSNLKMEAAPFGAIKDVAILSAMAGNVMTLALLTLAYPLLANVAPALHVQKIALSIGVMLGVSLLVFLFRGRIFSLRRGQLLFVFCVHLLRLMSTTLLMAVMWSLALPQLAPIWLVILSTLQSLVKRLPLVPSKDLLFANLAVFVIGQQNSVTAIILMISTAILATHLVVGGILALYELWKSRV